MTNNVCFPLNVIGLQWGDEGKGKIVDLLATRATAVVRYNGGNNAGHTVVVGKHTFKLSLLPSGVIARKKAYIAQGVVIDPEVLLAEIDFLNNLHIPIRLMIDPRVNVVMPYHKALDAATEVWKGKKATGSLHLGIGYCYEDKNNRSGIRMEDLIDPEVLKAKIILYTAQKMKRIQGEFNQSIYLDPHAIFKTYRTHGMRLKKYIADVSSEIGSQLKRTSACRVLFEGAHGTFLDGSFGTHPYTTAVYTISGSVFPYVGLAPQKIYTVGVVKAYTTRVGNGPFPTELKDKIGDLIRLRGGEYGTVSKRPRRCGWLDLPLIRTAIRLSGVDYLAVTKLDVLSSLTDIKICTHYSIGRKMYTEVPVFMNDFSRVSPVYKTFSGWKEDFSGTTYIRKLPRSAVQYIRFLERELHVPVRFVSTGAKRDATIIL